MLQLLGWEQCSHITGLMVQSILLPMHHVHCPRWKNYSQLEEEGPVLVFVVKHVHAYLFGQSFEWVIDHQPLLALLNEKKPTSLQASARAHCWSLHLSAYEYSLVFCKSEAHGNADALSMPMTIHQLHYPLMV